MTDAQRKLDHIRAALDQDSSARGAAFDRYRVLHNAMPDMDLDDVDTSCEFLGRRIAAPFLIASLTGGTPETAVINRNLAEAAQQARVPLALGSAKIVLKNPDAYDSFKVRRLCPDVPLLANLGLADLGRAFSLDDCRRLVHTLEADALIFHINPLHEALQKHGSTHCAGLFGLLAGAVQQLPVPVMVKEVGHGISARVFSQLDACGVFAIDVAGQGGASWGDIENRRAADPGHAAVCATFRDWGIPTPDILESLQLAPRTAQLVASGGVRNGLDIFKCLCLGADLASAGLPLLAPALQSAAAATARLERFITELRIALFATACPTPNAAHRGLLTTA